VWRGGTKKPAELKALFCQGEKKGGKSPKVKVHMKFWPKGLANGGDSVGREGQRRFDDSIKPASRDPGPGKTRNRGATPRYFRTAEGGSVETYPNPIDLLVLWGDRIRG